VYGGSALSFCLKVSAGCWREETIRAHPDKSAEEIFGGLDAMKVRSSMTLFDELSPNDVFAKVLDAFYHGARDEKTLELLSER